MNKTITMCQKRRLMTGIKYSILPIFLFSVLLSPDSLAQPPCKKLYLVIDGGDGTFFNRPYQAEASARDADSIEKWLKRKGFKGKKSSPTAHPRNEKLERLIESYMKELECPPGSQCCHELFIYIVAHGNPNRFWLFDEKGERGLPVTYAKLTSWLEKLPPCVKVKLTIFIEACHSGGAIEYLLKPLCKRFGKCGVTIMTTTDEKNLAPAGMVKGSNSGTQNFMNGADKDNDGDGDKGDIRDRWLEMEKKGKERAEKHGNPQLFMCDEQKRMCNLEKLPGTLPTTPQGVLYPPISGPLVATVQVREEETAYLSRQIGGQIVATVFVNDKPQDLPEPEEGIPVSPGDVIQLTNAVGTLLGHFTFTPEKEAPPMDKASVVECPLGQPAVVSVPGDYADTAIDDMVATTAPVETALTTGPEGVPAVTAPEGEVAIAPPGGLEPVLKTDDTVVAAGNLNDSAIGSNEVTVTDKNTGEVLGQARIDMWRLAGASLNPPVVDKGGHTNLRLNIFGPPDLQVEVTATAGEGLTPRKVTVTAPVSVLQSQGIGSFTATKSGTHNVSIRASTAIEGKEPVMGLPAWR